MAMLPVVTRVGISVQLSPPSGLVSNPPAVAIHHCDASPGLRATLLIVVDLGNGFRLGAKSAELVPSPAITKTPRALVKTKLDFEILF
jgi:hypothetical protein